MLHQSKVVIGGGPVGLIFAISLANKGELVTVIDSQYDFKNDSRILALSYASYIKLKEIGCWPDDAATAINQVHISHNGLGVSNIKASDVKLNCLGYTVSYISVVSKLRQVALNNPNIKFKVAEVKQVIPGANYATIEYIEKQDLEYLTSDLAVVAEGGRIKINNVDYTSFDYKRTALIATFDVDNYQPNIAFERFDKFGPLVLLPYNNQYKLVWSLESDVAQKIITEDDLMNHLSKQSSFMKRFGDFKVATKISSYPLYLQIAKQKFNNHVALIGNSSQTMNPISAQGMNLGIRDAISLANFIFQKQNLTDTSYDAIRNFDTNFVTGFTHLLARFVEQKSDLVNHLCGIGIIGLSNCKALQNKIANSLIFGL